MYARNSVIMLRNANNCSSFHGNTASRGGAAYLIDSSIYLIGTQNFTQNSAQQGGAMALSGSSKLILGEQLEALFCEFQAVANRRWSNLLCRFCFNYPAYGIFAIRTM